MFDDIFVTIGMFCGIFGAFATMLISMLKMKVNIDSIKEYSQDIKKLVYKDMEKDKEYRQIIFNTIDKFETMGSSQLRTCIANSEKTQDVKQRMLDQKFTMDSVKDAVNDFKQITKNNTEAMLKIGTYFEMLLKNGKV